MNFVERLFGVSPDGGNGTFELLLFLVPLMVLGALWLGHRAKRKHPATGESSPGDSIRICNSVPLFNHL